MTEEIIYQENDNNVEVPMANNNNSQSQNVRSDVEARLLSEVTATDKFLVDYLKAILQKKLSSQSFASEKLSARDMSNCIYPFEEYLEDLIEQGPRFFQQLISENDYETLGLDGTAVEFEACLDNLSVYDETEEISEEVCEAFDCTYGSIRVFNHSKLPTNLHYDEKQAKVYLYSHFLSESLFPVDRIYRIELQEGAYLYLLKLDNPGTDEYYELYFQKETALELEDDFFQDYDLEKELHPICSSANPHVAQLLAELYFKLYSAFRKPELPTPLIQELTKALGL